MDTTPLTAITDLAVKYCRASASPADFDLAPFMPLSAHMTRVIELMGAPWRVPGLLDGVAEVLATDPDLAPLRDAPADGLFVSHPAGGFRITLGQVPAALLGSALGQRYLFRLDEDEETLARLLLEGMQELKRALRGEPVRIYQVQGFEGVRLDPAVEISTPWGVFKAAPDVELKPGRLREAQTLLVGTSLVTPSVSAGDDDYQPHLEYWAAQRRRDVLFPLSCALGAGEHAQGAPVLSWSTVMLPFSGSGGVSGGIRDAPIREIDLTPFAGAVSEWARIVDERHDSAVDVASQRTVSALSLRADPTDALIDAVMAWENLVGTNAETTFRVTAALARLLEGKPPDRLALQKRLKAIYGTRSRVVHGESVDHQQVSVDGREAVGIAIRALQASYERGGDWLGLTSSERSIRLLVGE